MTIDEKLQQYFIPIFERWYLDQYVVIQKKAESSISRFIVIDNLFFLKLTYHCGDKWSFVKVDHHGKADISSIITFIVETNIYLLIDYIHALHQIALLQKEESTEYSFIK